MGCKSKGLSSRNKNPQAQGVYSPQRGPWATFQVESLQPSAPAKKPVPQAQALH